VTIDCARCSEDVLTKAQTDAIRYRSLFLKRSEPKSTKLEKHASLFVRKIKQREIYDPAASCLSAQTVSHRNRPQKELVPLTPPQGRNSRGTVLRVPSVAFSQLKMGAVNLPGFDVSSGVSSRCVLPFPVVRKDYPDEPVRNKIGEVKQKHREPLIRAGTAGLGLIGSRTLDQTIPGNIMYGDGWKPDSLLAEKATDHDSSPRSHLSHVISLPRTPRFDEVSVAGGWQPASEVQRGQITADVSAMKDEAAIQVVQERPTVFLATHESERLDRTNKSSTGDGSEAIVFSSKNKIGATKATAVKYRDATCSTGNCASVGEEINAFRSQVLN